MENPIHFGLSVSPSKPEDFAYFRSLCESEEGWDLSYDSDLTVHGREFPGTTARCIRVRGVIPGVTAETVFESLSDERYRDQWDTVCAESNLIHHLDERTNLGYYCIKCPFPLQNRDVVFQRSWSEVENGFIIMNHSVELPSHPPRPGIVRAFSLVTGYYMVNSGNGCIATYLSHSDPKVALPQWLCNKIATLLAPGIFRRLFTAVKVYEAWKAEHGQEESPDTRAEYADPESLSEWGFPPPPPGSIKEPGIELEDDKSDSDPESFYSADEDQLDDDASCEQSQSQ